MITKVQRWGNSQGLRIAKPVLEKAQIKIGDQVDVIVEDGKIIIQPINKIRGKYRLTDLVSAITETYKSEDPDWGIPTGKEAW